MDWMDLVYDVLKLCVIPMLGVLTTYAVKWLSAKETEVLERVDNETADKYLTMIFETVRDCVSATTQTYVDALKKKGSFDAEAQREAFKMTYDAVVSILADDAKDYIVEVYGDLTAYLTTKIEAEVKAQK